MFPKKIILIPLLAATAATGLVTSVNAVTFSGEQTNRVFKIDKSDLCLKSVQKSEWAYLARNGECSGDNRLWSISAVGTDSFRIKTGKRCLTAVAGDNASVRVDFCKNESSQLWSLVSTTSGNHYRIKSALDGKCLEAKSRQKAGSKTFTTSCADARDKQIWSIAADTQTTGGSGQRNAKWSMPIELGLVAASAAVDPITQKVRVWSGSSQTSFGDPTPTYFTTFDWRTNSVANLGIYNIGSVFCQGSAIDGNGVLTVAGGLNYNSTYSWGSEATFTKGASLTTWRGYNTLVTLGNGNLFTLGGSWNVTLQERKGEIWNGTTWRKLSGLLTKDLLTQDGVTEKRDNYMWLIPTGGSQVFQAGPSRKMHWIDTSGNGSITPAGLRALDGDAMNGNAILYAPGKILTVGGAPQFTEAQATNNAHVIDISGGFGMQPNVRRVQSMKHARAYATSVLLPDGRVVVVGGQSYASGFKDSDAVLAPELFDPATETFTELPSMIVPRTYHSIAILLPDGRVLAAGGGLCGSCQTNHTDAEILSPPYLFDKDGRAAERPTLDNVPGSARAGAEIKVTSNGVDFVLVRYSSTTHAMNSDQRRFVLKDREAPGDNDDLILTLPTVQDGFVPGAYMLFALGETGTPSYAKTIILR